MPFFFIFAQFRRHFTYRMCVCVCVCVCSAICATFKVMRNLLPIVTRVKNREKRKKMDVNNLQGRIK